jgi:hypothetical protein
MSSVLYPIVWRDHARVFNPYPVADYTRLLNNGSRLPLFVPSISLMDYEKNGFDDALPFVNVIRVTKNAKRIRI